MAHEKEIYADDVIKSWEKTLLEGFSKGKGEEKFFG